MAEHAPEAQQQRPNTVDGVTSGATREEKKALIASNRSKVPPEDDQATKKWDSSNLVHIERPLPVPKDESAVKKQKKKQQGGPSAAEKKQQLTISEQLAEAKVLAQKWMQQRDAVESGKAKELTFNTDSPVQFVLPSCQGSLFEGPEGYSVPSRHLQLMLQKSPRSLSPRLNASGSRKNASSTGESSARGKEGQSSRGQKQTKPAGDSSRHADGRQSKPKASDNAAPAPVPPPTKKLSSDEDEEAAPQQGESSLVA